MNLFQVKSKSDWQEKQQAAFETSKSEFQQSPVLLIFGPTLLPCTVIPDCSNLALGAILLQPNTQGVLHPAAYIFYTPTVRLEYVDACVILGCYQAFCTQ